MKRLIAALALVLTASPAMAQNTTGLVVPACGSTTPLYLAGRPGAPTVDVNGNLCTGGSMPGTVPGTAPGSTTIIGGVYNSTPPVPTTGQALPLQLDYQGSVLSKVGNEQSYSASIAGLVPPATPTDIFCITGSANKIINIKRLDMSGTATATTIVDVLLNKHSTANTGGTSSTLTNVPHDSNNAAATATVAAYTVNPTVGTVTGILDAFKMTIATAGIQINERLKLYGTEEMQAIKLRGVAEQVCVNLNGVTAAGNNYDISIDWTERAP